MTDYLLQLSVPLSLLLVLLVATQKHLLKQFGPRTTYALWATVPMLLMVAISTPLIPALANAQSLQRYQVGVQQLTGAASSINWLLWLWLSGVAFCIGFILLSYASSRALFNRAKPVHVRTSSVSCRQADYAAGPYISGLLSPYIVLPADFFQRFDPTQQQLILQHELTHWRRGDVHLNYVALLIVSLFWFNPLVWLAYVQYRNVQELVCDAVVTKHASPAQRIAYGYALLSSTQQSPSYGWPLTHHYGEFNIMKQRIMQLQQQQGFSKAVVSGAMALVIVSTLLLQQPVLAGTNKAKPLAAVTRVEPRYPLQAAQQGISGYVQIKFDVDAQGKVVNASVIKSSPEQVFDKEALHALQQWRYTATGVEHKAQRIQLDFELDVPHPDMERVSVTPPPPKKG
jgi:bla regulator protein blaR1